jgi:mono/diheme cytochrome c family protein
MCHVIALGLLAAGALWAQAPPTPLSGSAARGGLFFERNGCAKCHSVNAVGGKTAPDLGTGLARGYTPARLAATLWNHAPVMWSAMADQSMGFPRVNESDAADLFAYFVLARYFERPGDAGRGKAAFAARQCQQCHGITESSFPGAKPVKDWTSLGSPVGLVEAMWNHAGQMKDAFASRQWKWSALTSAELGDIQVYLRNLPATRSAAKRDMIAAGSTGQSLFDSKGCAKCHTGSLELAPRLRGKTLTDVAVSMWNHAPQMSGAAIRFQPGEMSDLLSYLWAQRFFDEPGDASSGERVVAQRGCRACHGNAESGAPPFSALRGRATSIRIVSALWSHGPTMLDQMTKRGVPWPRISTREMMDLIAFINRE